MGWIELVLHAADSALRSVMGMRQRFVLRRSESRASAVRAREERDRNQAYARQSAAIVKSRPPQLEERYAVLQEPTDIDGAFRLLRKELLLEVDKLNEAAREEDGSRLIQREIGVTAEKRHFLFLKPFNDYGWLLERSGAGWRVSRAEKIVSQDMFLRSNADPWDLVNVYEDPSGEGAHRVKSQRFGGALLALPVYHDRMKQAFIAELTGLN
jgi:hypothetical protein